MRRGRRSVAVVALLLGVAGVGGYFGWQFHAAGARDDRRVADLAVVQRQLQPLAAAGQLPETLPSTAPPPAQASHPYTYRAEGNTFLACTTFERRDSAQALFVTASGQFRAPKQYCQNPLEPRIATIVTTAGLTPEGIGPFLENVPQLGDGATIKHECQLGDDGEVLFGCYLADRQKIWILDVSDPGLAGVSTAAAMHELVHAVEAADPPPADQLEAEATRRADPQLDQELSLYDSDERVSELAARIGTQFPDLPPGLAAYYGRYFDQSAVAAAYRPYGELVGQVTRLQARLEADQRTLDQLKAAGRFDEYNARVDGYNAQVERYNALAARYNFAGQ